MPENSVHIKDEVSEIIGDDGLGVDVDAYSELDLAETSKDVERMLSGEPISSNGLDEPVYPTDPSQSTQTDLYTPSSMISDPHSAQNSAQNSTHTVDPALPAPPAANMPNMPNMPTTNMPNMPDMPSMPAQPPQSQPNDRQDLDFLPLDNLGDLDPSNLPDPLSLFDFENNHNSEATSEETERERMKLLISYFDEQQMARYLAFRRANIRRAAVRKYASQLLNQPVSNNVAMVLAGMSKVLIGDIIELAREIQDKNQGRAKNENPIEGQEPDPLLPSSIREAWKICSRDITGIPGSRTRPGSANRFF